MHALNIPRHKDPIAGLALLGMVCVVAWLAINQPSPSSARASASDDIIIIATPALSQRQAFAPRVEQPTTAQPEPTVEPAPAVQSAAPTAAPPTAAPPAPTTLSIAPVAVEAPIEVVAPTLAPPTPEPTLFGSKPAPDRAARHRAATAPITTERPAPEAGK